LRSSSITRSRGAVADLDVGPGSGGAELDTANVL
jgi:hypothetical protein